MAWTLTDFVRESNRIEAIHRDPTPAEIAATELFLAEPAISVVYLSALVSVYQPDARPRFHRGLDVRVGNHFPPPGGPHIEIALEKILSAVNSGSSAYVGHVAYETLHPFTDGNGRSGRALWLWSMGGIARAPLGFLHHFYYQALQASRPDKDVLRDLSVHT